jgi:hypothetical protein
VRKHNSCVSGGEHHARRRGGRFADLLACPNRPGPDQAARYRSFAFTFEYRYIVSPDLIDCLSLSSLKSIFCNFRMLGRAHAQSTREKPPPVPTAEELATFELAQYNVHWSMGAQPAGRTTPQNGFYCLIKDTKWCKFRSTKNAMADHLASCHQLRMGNAPRGRPPKDGKLPPRKRSEQARIGEKDRSSGDFGLKMWKNKKAKMYSCFLHAAKDRSTPIRVICKDYQRMYFRWRYDNAFDTTLRNTWSNVREYWSKKIEEGNDPLLDWTYVKEEVRISLNPLLFCCGYAHRFSYSSCNFLCFCMFPLHFCSKFLLVYWSFLFS